MNAGATMQSNLLEVLPIVNAMGIPLLAFAFFMLFRSYQRADKTSKDLIAQFREENERLRLRLAAGDDSYMELAGKIRSIVRRSTDAIEELEARKIELLAKGNPSTEETIQIEVRKIDQSISRIEDLHNLYHRYDERLREEGFRTREDLRYLTKEISGLAAQIGDIRSRVAIVSVVTSSEAQERLRQTTADIERGLVARSEDDHPVEEESSKEPVGPFFLPPGGSSDAVPNEWTNDLRDKLLRDLLRNTHQADGGQGARMEQAADDGEGSHA